MSSALVSVVVLNYNGKAYIEKCLDSLLTQSYPNSEVIVVDNASTDGSREIIQNYATRVKLILNEQNLGVSKGNNLGIRAAKGEFIALFNNDAYADRDWLLKLTRVLEENPETGIVSGPVYYWAMADVLWSAGGRYDVMTGLSWHLGQYEKRYNPPQDIDYFPSCSVLIKREVFDSIGLWDEGFFIYCDDLDFCLRAKRAGFGLRYVADAPVWHAVSPAMKKEPSKLNTIMVESEFRLIFKQAPPPIKPLAVFLRLIVIPFGEVMFLGRSLSWIPLVWRAYSKALGGRFEERRNGTSISKGKHPLRVRCGECLSVMLKRRRQLRDLKNAKRV